MKAKATYTIGSGRFAGKTVDILDQWDYTGAKYELYEFDAHGAKHNEWKKAEMAIANSIGQLTGPSSKFSRPRKRLIKNNYGEVSMEIIRHKSNITLTRSGIKVATVNVDKSTIPYLNNRGWTSEFIAYVLDVIIQGKGDESNSDIVGTLAYKFRTSDDPAKGRNLWSYNTLHVPNNSLPSRDNNYYPMYDNDGTLWYYCANKSGGGAVRLSPDQLLSTLKLCNPRKRFGAYMCQDLSQMHSAYDADNTYFVGGKRVGPSTHTNGFQAIGKAINDNYFSNLEHHPYYELVTDVIRCVYNQGELTKIPDDERMHWQREYIKRGQLPIGIIDRWGNKKAPLVVFKSPVDYAEEDFKNEVIKNIVEGATPETAWRQVRNSPEAIKLTDTGEEWDDTSYNVLKHIGLELKFTNRTY